MRLRILGIATALAVALGAAFAARFHHHGCDTVFEVLLKRAFHAHTSMCAP